MEDPYAVSLERYSLYKFHKFNINMNIVMKLEYVFYS